MIASEFRTFPMHLASGLVTLREVLADVPDNRLVWRVLDFEGVGAAPAGMSQQAFERATRAAPDGYRMDWAELLDLADHTEQTWNCLIVGARPDVSTWADRVEDDGFAGCDYVVRAFDSSEWSLGVATGARGIRSATANAD